MRPAVLPLVTRHASEWFGGGDDTLRYGCPPPNWIHPENVAGQAALNVRHAVTGGENGVARTVRSGPWPHYVLTQNELIESYVLFSFHWTKLV
jgi:hypothetical protein